MGVIRQPHPDWCTHIPLLIEAFNQTDGPVLEMGMGDFSTPLLHILCAESDRFLLSVDSDSRFTDRFHKFRTSNHAIELVDFNKLDLSDTHWSVVLIDHKPEEQRKEDIKKLKDKADFLVVHDTQPKAEPYYRYEEIYPLFKYRYTDDKFPTYTTILSNFRELK